jgi:hypothetical protein
MQTRPESKADRASFNRVILDTREGPPFDPFH